MRVLWVCNIMLPVIAKHLGLEASNKEGWLSGLADTILSRQQDNCVELGVAFPVSTDKDGLREKITFDNGSALMCYGFYEDVAHAEQYEEGLEERIGQIVKDFRPDVVHCFGTEYGHTLAVTKVCEPGRVLVGIQGLCALCAKAYMADLPVKVQKSVTFRDWLKKDTILMQQEKFAKRGEREIAVIRNAGNVTGRTDWDRHHVTGWNPEAKYFAMNETLRPLFYTGEWKEESCKRERIFLSQGDYPLKGLHYMLFALPGILKEFPHAKVCVAGNSLVAYETLKDKIKLSAYGKYLRSIIRRYGLEDHVEFLGRLTGEQMKEEYLKANVFVCCSSVENSPNSLGEAMILGVPCVCPDVGGIPSLFDGGRDGVMYAGYRMKEAGASETDVRAGLQPQVSTLEEVSANLKEAVLQILRDPAKSKEYGANARKHALKTHDKEENYSKMIQIYASIMNEG